LPVQADARRKPREVLGGIDREARIRRLVVLEQGVVGDLLFVPGLTRSADQREICDNFPAGIKIDRIAF
jgi:hypothetical protein